MSNQPTGRRDLQRVRRGWAVAWKRVRRSGLRGEAKLAWWFLSRLAQREGRSLPCLIEVTAAAVAADQGLVERSGRRSLKALRDAGLVKVEGRAGSGLIALVGPPRATKHGVRAGVSDPQRVLEFAAGDELTKPHLAAQPKVVKTKSRRIAADESRGARTISIGTPRTHPPADPSAVPQKTPSRADSDLELNLYETADSSLKRTKTKYKEEFEAKRPADTSAAGNAGLESTLAAAIEGLCDPSRQSKRIDAVCHEIGQLLAGDELDAHTLLTVAEHVADGRISPGAFARLKCSVRKALQKGLRPGKTPAAYFAGAARGMFNDRPDLIWPERPRRND